MRDRWGDGVWSALLETRERLAAILPGLFVLVVLLALGVLLGFVAKVVLERGARALGFDRVMERWGVAASLRRSGAQRAPSGVLGLLAFWAIRSEERRVGKGCRSRWSPYGSAEKGSYSVVRYADIR